MLPTHIKYLFYFLYITLHYIYIYSNRKRTSTESAMCVCVRVFSTKCAVYTAWNLFIKSKYKCQYFGHLLYFVVDVVIVVLVAVVVFVKWLKNKTDVLQITSGKVALFTATYILLLLCTARCLSAHTISTLLINIITQ